MQLHSYSGEGVVLARRNFGEADRLLSIYTKDHGRVALIAKGVRRPKSKKRGHVEIFSLLKFEAVAGSGLDIMTEAEITDDFKEVRQSLARISLAYYFCEVVGKITHEGEANKDLFNLLTKYLTDLKHSTGLKKMRNSFVKEVLVLLGYWPKGAELTDPDKVLEEVVERQIASVRVGKRMLE